MAAMSKPLKQVLLERKAPILTLAAILVLLRSRLISKRLPSLDIGRPHTLSTQELEDAQQQLYHEEEDGSKTLIVPFRGNVAKASCI